MGIRDADRTLASNRLIFDARRDPAMYSGFADKLERFMADYRLTDDEKAAWRAIDIKRLAELGVHPYFLPQVARLFKGGGYNHNASEAAQLYARKMGIE